MSTQWLETVLMVPRAGITIRNAYLISLLCLSPLPHPVHTVHTRNPPSYPDLFPRNGMPFPLHHLTNSSLPFKSYLNGISANPSLASPCRVLNTLPCSLSILYLSLAEREIRDWKTWTDISIHQLIAQFILWLSFFGLHQRDLHLLSLPEKA